MSFELPPGLTPADEGRHAAPPGAEGLIYGDTLWVSVVDPKAGIHGVNHFHLTNRGFARFEALYVIDGVVQMYGNKVPLSKQPDAGPWSDGQLRYEVVKPFEHIRISMDGRKFGFELDFKGRFAPFDYTESRTGDPLAIACSFHGGHFEQAMSCTGHFEIRGGPSKGETRPIDCWSHRDHTWSDRFSQDTPWELFEAHFPGHYWPSIQLPDRHINVFGFYFQNHRAPDNKAIGGFVSDEKGSRPMRGCKAELFPAEGPACRAAQEFRYELVLPDEEVIHVRSTRNHGQIKLWDRAEEDLENRLDCYEAFVEWQVEETGEVGTGVAEYSIHPVWPRWTA